MVALAGDGDKCINGDSNIGYCDICQTVMAMVLALALALIGGDDDDIGAGVGFGEHRMTALLWVQCGPHPWRKGGTVESIDGDSDYCIE